MTVNKELQRKLFKAKERLKRFKTKVQITEDEIIDLQNALAKME